MIIVTYFTQYIKDGVVVITGTEVIPCPICGGRLFVHGTCIRRVKAADGEIMVFRLRVMECADCHHTHREIPSSIITPYKRFGTEAISQMAEDPEECCVEPLVMFRILVWLSLFFIYAQGIEESLIQRNLLGTKYTGRDCRDRLSYYVRIVVNSGERVQHRSVTTVT